MNRFALLLPALAALWSLGLGTDPGHADTLAAPFPPSILTPAPCVPPPAPVRDIRVGNIYSDSASTVIDPAGRAADEAASRPLREFLRRVQRPVRPSCALAGLDGWARAGALLGTLSHQGAYQREWTLSGAALAFLELRDAPGLDPEAMQRVTAWLHQVAASVQPHYDQPAMPGKVTDIRNNHAYWAGLAVAASGIAAGDRAMLDWGFDRARIGLDQVTQEGALPMELARGPLALHYHFFALKPLAALAWLAVANNTPLGGPQMAKLRQLADFSFNSVEHPHRINELARAVQNDPFIGSRSPLTEAAGLAIWTTLYPNRDISAAIAPYMPYEDPWLGGAVGRLFR